MAIQYFRERILPVLRLQPQRLDWVQSRLVLPTARTLYLAGALLCGIAIVLALLVALASQLSSWRPIPQRSVPDARPVASVAPTFERVEQRLAGPRNIAFAPRLEPGEPLGNAQVVGGFTADAANKLADFPDDFDIVGGRDAGLFEEAFFFPTGRTGLQAKPELAAAMNNDKALGKASRSFVVRVSARDTLGNRSPPVDVAFTIDLGPTPSASPELDATMPEAEPAVTELGGASALNQIAERLAAIVDPTRGTPAYFDAVEYALAEPERCGAAGNPQFIASYGNAFGTLRKRLTKDNLTGFYQGLCEAWSDAREKTAAAAAAAEAERQRIAEANDTARSAAESSASSARMTRNAALVFAMTAVSAFMMIALFLAFLAIEGHSNAVRLAIEALAARKEE